MRLLGLFLFAVVLLTGCNEKKPKTIMEDAARGIRPTSSDVKIVYKYCKDTGGNISESEVEEFLNLMADIANERDFNRKKRLWKRYNELLDRIQAKNS